MKWLAAITVVVLVAFWMLARATERNGQARVHVNSNLTIPTVSVDLSPPASAAAVATPPPLSEDDRRMLGR